MRKVPGTPRKHRLPAHRHRTVRVDRRPVVQIPPPSRLPFADCITRLSVVGDKLHVEYV